MFLADLSGSCGTSSRVTTLRWVMPKISDGPADAEQTLAKAFSLHPVAARVLVNRGYSTEETAKAFLSESLADLPDPFRMKGMPAAVERIARAITEQHAVTLYGDYDVDGVSSTALLTSFLRDVGLTVRTYIPHRLGEGYGLNLPAIERLASEGTKLLITLDCGITSHAEVARAGALGLDVIVVDHHAVPETMPPALAVLNPLQPGCDYPTKWLCAGGVTFNLCMGLRKTLRERGFFAKRAEPNLKQYLDLVALATVADVVPLVGANRILVIHGLRELTSSRRPGVRALKDVAELTGAEITAGQVGFRLGPRINAAGRLDDASVGLQLLLSTTYEAARPLALTLDAANAERQQIERNMVQSAIDQATVLVERGARGLVLADERWHPGVVGIVASRIVERFHRPAVVIGSYQGTWRGSGRSIEGFHLYDALKRCEHHLSKFGGHKAAAGLSIDPALIEAFRVEFESVTGSILGPDDLYARCRIDAVVTTQELTEEAVKSLQKLAPFGMGNPEPVLSAHKQVANPRVLMNKNVGEPGHLKLSLESAPMLDVIGFRFAEKAPLTEAPVDLAFQVSIDAYRGVPRVSLKLKDIRAISQ